MSEAMSEAMSEGGERSEPLKGFGVGANVASRKMAD
jgi:hypothetical protein